MIVCITGMPGSGKSVAADIMKKRGFKVLEMGNVVREMMRKKGIKITNKSIREFALRLREEGGRTAVASVVGIGGLAGAIGGGLFQELTGIITSRSHHNYLPLFAMACCAYPLALLILHVMTPRLAPARIAGRLV